MIITRDLMQTTISFSFIIGFNHHGPDGGPGAVFISLSMEALANKHLAPGLFH
jgi:hypothetical protein